MIAPVIILLRVAAMETHINISISYSKSLKYYIRHVPLLTRFDDVIEFTEQYAKINIMGVFILWIHLQLSYLLHQTGLEISAN